MQVVEPLYPCFVLNVSWITCLVIKYKFFYTTLLGVMYTNVYLLLTLSHSSINWKKVIGKVKHVFDIYFFLFSHLWTSRLSTDDWSLFFILSLNSWHWFSPGTMAYFPEWRQYGWCHGLIGLKVNEIVIPASTALFPDDDQSFTADSGYSNPVIQMRMMQIFPTAKRIIWKVEK